MLQVDAATAASVDTPPPQACTQTAEDTAGPGHRLALPAPAAPTVSAVAMLTATTKAAVPGTAEAAGGAAGGGPTAWTTLRRGRPGDQLFASRLALLAEKEEGRRTRRGCVN